MTAADKAQTGRKVAVAPGANKPLMKSTSSSPTESWTEIIIRTNGV